MESNDSYQVFHTRLVRTQRRRLTWPDGRPGGWLILNAADQFTELTAEVSELGETLAGLARDRRDRDDPPQAEIPHPRQSRP